MTGTGRINWPGRTCRWFAVAALALMLAPAAYAQVGDQIVSETQKGKGKPVEITAKEAESLQKANQVVFTGDVQATKGNVRMTSEKLVVDYKKVAGKIKPVLLNALGNVVVVSKGQTVQAQWAKMDMAANTVVMGDSVTVIDGKSVIRGKRLHLNLTTGRSKLVGGNNRVQGTFFD